MGGGCKGGSPEATKGWYHPRGHTLRVALEPRLGQETQWEMAHVCRLYVTQQSLPPRFIPPSSHRPTSRFYRWLLVAELPGRILQISLGVDGYGG